MWHRHDELVMKEAFVMGPYAYRAIIMTEWMYL